MDLYEKAVAGIDEWKENNPNGTFGTSSVMDIVNKDNPNPIGLIKSYEIFKRIEKEVMNNEGERTADNS